MQVSVKMSLALAGMMVVAPVAAKGLDLSTACNLKEEIVVPNFKGHDIRAVYAALEKVGLVKDEFETTAQFEARKADVFRNLPVGISNGELCAVWEPAGESYDADLGLLQIEVFPNEASRLVVDGKVREIVIFPLVRGDEQISTYTANNVYGAPVVVTRTTERSFNLSFDYELLMRRLVGAGGEWAIGYMTLPVWLEPAEARLLKGQVAFALQYEVVYPFATQELDIKLPEADWPFARENRQSVVFATAVRAVAFDKRTGEVLARYGLDADAMILP